MLKLYIVPSLCSFQAKIDGLVKFQQVLTAERAQIVHQYNTKRAAGALTARFDDEFWVRLAELDSLLERTGAQVI
jgi:hypothetical protein